MITVSQRDEQCLASQRNALHLRATQRNSTNDAPPRSAPPRSAPRRPATQRNSTNVASHRNATLLNATPRNSTQRFYTEGEDMKRLKLFEMSADARLLMQEVKKMKVGDEVRYSALQKLVGKKITASSSSLKTARRHAFNDDGIVTEAIVGLGIRRLVDEEIVSSGRRDTRFMRRRSRRIVERLTYGIQDFFAMTPQKQNERTAIVSVQVMAMEAMKESNFKKIEKAAAGNSTELPIKATIEAFLK